MAAVIDARRLRPSRLAVLGQEGLLERRLAADEVGQLVLRGGAHDVGDVARDAHAQDVVLGDDVADAGQRAERLDRHGPGEDQLDLVVGEVAQRLGPIDARQLAAADDRHAVTRLLDLGQDVRGQEDGPALVLGLADDRVELLLDERVEAGCRLVEQQQVGPVLEGDDQPDLLLVALRVLAELARRVDLEALDQVLLVRAGRRRRAGWRSSRASGRR